MKGLGAALIAIGIVLIIITGFNVVTEKKVVDLGPIQVDKKENHPVRWSPILGGVLILSGVVIMAANKNKN